MRKIKQLWTACLFVVVLCSCSAEQDEIIPPSVSTDNVIEFTFAFPEDGQDIKTRAREYLKNGDKAYITAEVTTSGGPEVMSFILKYNNGAWEGDGTVPTWPENSLKATFTAYLLPPTFSLSMSDNSTVAIPLSSLKEATDDPFMARVKDIPVNGIVPLQFAHTTSKLIVTGLKLGITEKVRFYNADPTFVLNNQIEFSYSTAEGFTHKFTHKESNGNYIEQEIQNTVSRVAFFLDVDTAYWEKHIEFRLDQITTSGNYGTAENPETVKTTSLADRTGLRAMLRGRAYSMYFLDGQTNNDFKEEEKWYGEQNKRVPFTSAEEIIAYFDGLTSLEEDLDFNFIDLDGLDLRSSVSTKGIALNNSLNGNHHTIRNIIVKNGLFNEIPSGKIIQNLRLENVKVEASGDDTSDAGLLAPVNNGIIKNVRISGNNSIGTDNVSNVGGMVGTNSGDIIDSQIEGTLIIECDGDGLTAGGFVGDNGGTITGSKVISASIISASTSTAGASVGGFVGVNGGYIKSSSTNTLVNATQVKAGTSHTGGFAGENSATLISCEATGDVKGGASGGTVRVGGFAGYIAGDVDKCYATGYVYENNASTNAQIGGFGGYSNTDLSNCSSTGKLFIASDHAGRDVGALVGLLSATSTIYNSFSVSTTSTGGELGFGGSQATQADNCHYLGFILNTATGDYSERIPTNAQQLNNSRGSYSEWTSNSSYINGVPYLVKEK